MMREILFKAKRLDNSEWVDGFYILIDDKTCISFSLSKHSTGNLSYHAYFEIDPKTLSQFTGLLDKNGNKIFEGDILEFKEEDIIYQGNIKYCNGIYMFLLKNNSFIIAGEIKENDWELIGNIHD